MGDRLPKGLVPLPCTVRSNAAWPARLDLCSVFRAACCALHPSGRPTHPTAAINSTPTLIIASISPRCAGSTKREPTVVGKPAEFMLENIATKFGLRREQVTSVFFFALYGQYC